MADASMGFTFWSAGLSALAVWLSFAVVKVIRVADQKERMDLWALGTFVATVVSTVLFFYGLGQGWAARTEFQGVHDVGLLPWLGFMCFWGPGVFLGIVSFPMRLRDLGRHLRHLHLDLALPALGVALVFVLAGQGLILVLGTLSAALNIAFAIFVGRNALRI